MALKFHKLRNANPQLFFHRNVNKGVYGAFGMLVHWLLAINHSLNHALTIHVRRSRSRLSLARTSSAFRWSLRSITTNRRASAASRA